MGFNNKAGNYNFGSDSEDDEDESTRDSDELTKKSQKLKEEHKLKE
jgi:hypothetical protein